MTGPVAKIRRSLHQYGIRMTLGLIVRNLYYEYRWWLDRRFDRRFGVLTSGQTQLQEIAFESPNKVHGIRYESPAVSRVRAMLAELPADLSRFTFVDFGSGKGRILLLAAEHNFTKVIGVEFVPPLHAAALANIRSYRNPRQRCFDITSLCMDAESFSIPEGPCVFYFYDPFREAVMSKVLSNIAASYRAAPRKLYLIYCCPVHRGMIEQLGFFHLRPTRRLPFTLAGAPRQYKFVFYETVD